MEGGDDKGVEQSGSGGSFFSGVEEVLISRDVAYLHPTWGAHWQSF
jgi:hypothetical protein